MLRSLRQLFREKPVSRPLPSVPTGERYYAIGDIHGRLDLFDALIEAIEKDDKALPAAQTTVVVLGDLVDRGPHSAAVIDRARAWKKQRKVRFIAGNHEEMFLQSFDDREMLRHFIKHGGRETLLSYGIKRKRFNELNLKALQTELGRLVPAKHRKFISSFENMILAGDYLFVHAGIHPKRPITEQRQSDLRWIRDRFLKHTEPFSHVIVHGHTIFEKVDTAPSRIGIDTGAFRSGRLSSLVLEGTTRRTIQAVATGGTITIEKATLA